MSRPVTVTMFAAKDGSLHETAASAEWHDKCRAKDALRDKIIRIIELDLFNLLRFKVKRWDDLDEYDQNNFIEQIADLIGDKFDELEKAIRS